MSVKLGNTNITKAYLGTALVSKMYLGASQAFPEEGSPYETEAQLYIDVHGGFSEAEKGFVNDFVLTGKTDGWFAKGICGYPYLKATATEQKWNIFNPVDSDAAHRATFFGGFTHNENGCQGNGTNGYLETHMTPSLHMTNNSTSMVFSSKTSAQATDVLFGGDDDSWTPRMVLHPAYTDGNAYGDMYNYQHCRIAPANTDGSGVFILTRTASNLVTLYKDGASIGSSAGSAWYAGTSMSNFDKSFVIHALKHMGTGGIWAHSNRLGTFSGFFDSLTAAEALSLTTAIQTLDINFGR